MRKSSNLETDLWQINSTDFSPDGSFCAWSAVVDYCEEPFYGKCRATGRSNSGTSKSGVKSDDLRCGHTGDLTCAIFALMALVAVSCGWTGLLKALGDLESLTVSLCPHGDRTRCGLALPSPKTVNGSLRAVTPARSASTNLA